MGWSWPRLSVIIRPTFARQDDRLIDSRPCQLLGWRASRSSGVSRAKAGGEGSRTPVLKTVVPNFYMRSRSRESELSGSAHVTHPCGHEITSSSSAVTPLLD